MSNVLSKALVAGGFGLVLVPGTAWLIFWSYFYLGLGIEGVMYRHWPVGHGAALAMLALVLCWGGVLSLWRLFFVFIQGGPPRPWPVRLATLLAFAGALQLAMAFPIMAVLRPLPEAGLGLALYWGWLGSRGFGFTTAMAAQRAWRR